MRYILKELEEQLVDLKDERKELNAKHNHNATIKDVMNNIDDINYIKEQIAKLRA